MIDNAFCAIPSLFSWTMIFSLYPNFFKNPSDWFIKYLYFVVTNINSVFFDGCTFELALKLRIPIIISFNFSISSSSALKLYFSSNCGNFEIIILSSILNNCKYISSVINGIIGCNNFNEFINTSFNVTCAINLLSLSSPYKRVFTISIYQSQNSFHIKSYIFCVATPKS